VFRMGMDRMMMMGRRKACLTHTAAGTTILSLELLNANLVHLHHHHPRPQHEERQTGLQRSHSRLEKKTVLFVISYAAIFPGKKTRYT
jgi:hypothetical protein